MSHIHRPQQAHAFARSDRSSVGIWWWTTDRWMLGAVAALIAIGVMMSFAASPAAAARMNVGDPFHFAVRQCVFAVTGAAIIRVSSMPRPMAIITASEISTGVTAR